MEDARTEEINIRKLWRNGGVSAENVPSMDSWLSWWGATFGHWGSLSNVQDNVDMPTVNLSESKHSSWKAGQGGRKKISLYDTCATDMLNEIMQTTKEYAYREGKYKGIGPNAKILQDCLQTRCNPTPSQLAQIVCEAT